MILNSVSRSLSEVGRSPSHVGGFRRRPFNAPAITRTASSPSIPRTQRDRATKPQRHRDPGFLCVFVSLWLNPPCPPSTRCLLPDLDQLEPLRPVRDQPADR